MSAPSSPGGPPTLGLRPGRVVLREDGTGSPRESSEPEGTAAELPEDGAGDGPLVATITLQRPGQHNALGAEDIACFREHLEAVDADARVRVLVVTGTGDETFCSGALLGEIERGELTPTDFAALTERLAAVRVPTAAALNGSVYGGGVEIALCCDLRIGIEGTRLLVPAARLGMCYPPAGVRRFVERLGLGAATRILVAAEELDADEMHRTGFLTHLVSREALGSTTAALVERLATSAPLAVRAMKEILNGVARGSLDARRAEALARACAESRDLAEGLRARREGEEPRFEGR